MLFTTHTFKDRLKSGSIGNDGIAKEWTTTCKQIGPEEDRTLEFCITTDSVDRHGDVVSASAWQTAAFMRNPVVLFAHSYDSLPVGRALNITPLAHSLRSVVQFAPESANPFAEQVYQMCKGGFLNAASVGFIPLEYEEADREGYFPMDIKKAELIEWSIVPVPANAACLIAASAAGINVGLVKQWAERSFSRVAKSSGSDELSADEITQIVDDAFAEHAAGAKQLSDNEIVSLVNQLCNSAGLPATKTAPGQVHLSEADVRAIAKEAADQLAYHFLGRVPD